MPRRFAEMKSLAGTELGVSSWVSVGQSMIDGFAELTGDRQWIHVDVSRARREAPGGSTIAHGFLTLSLIARLGYELDMLPADAVSFNYGLDRLRFINPVRAGQRVRLHARNVAVEEKAPGRLLLRNAISVEIEGEDKPALAAEALTLLVAADAG
ncbi:MAG: MaoC family dehydratase [Rhizobiaceae bacterium]|nr:MaoC family dehydratase [Rhizobiaceae bacterium]